MKYKAISQVTLANMLVLAGCDRSEDQPSFSTDLHTDSPALAAQDEQAQAKRVLDTLHQLGFKGARWDKRGSEDVTAIGAFQPEDAQAPEGSADNLFCSGDDDCRSRRSSVLPRLECVEQNGQTISAYWGYDNNTGESVEIPVSWRNRFFPGQSENGQPTEFEAGSHEFVFSNEFSRKSWLAWILDGKFRIATSWSKQCGQDADIEPLVKCVEELDNGDFRAHFSYDNKGSNTERVAIGPQNRVRPGPRDQGQPELFLAGVHEDVFTGTFKKNRRLAWRLTGKRAVANKNTVRCEPDPTECTTDVQCSDSDLCTGLETCDLATGECVGAPDLDCGDTNECTADSCDAINGCVYEAVSDGTVCENNGIPGICQSGMCTPETGCSTDAECQDDTVCNGLETCEQGACVSGQGLECGDANVCDGEETCDPVNGCQDGTPLDCEDSNECTADTCDEANGCQSDAVANGTPCTGGLCQDGMCDTGLCTSDADCNTDNDVCDGIETCNLSTGQCEDGTPLSCENDNLCDGTETCDPVDGCQDGTVLDCDDNEGCTADSCDEATGCTNEAVADGTVCDNNGNPGVCESGLCTGCLSDADCQDDTVCNGQEACVDQACISGQELECDNANVCDGVETCDPTNGCQDASDLDCEDNNECTADSCDEIDGCSNEAVANDTPCTGGTCQEGVCEEPSGTTITLDHTGRGAFNSPFVVENVNAPWKVLAGSYQIRHIGGFSSESAPASRDYFSFGLGGVQGTVVSAELRITHPSSSYDSTDASETITLFDVSTDTADLESPATGGPISVLEGIFNDLGDGNGYGSFTADASDNGSVEVIQLNAAAIADIQAAIASGSDWSVGGSLTSPATTLPFGNLERVFRGSDESGGTPQPATQLVLTGDLSPSTTFSESIQATDLGYYLRAFTPTDNTLQSFHWESPAGEHQSYFTGNQTQAAFSVERRPYYVFDLTGKSGIVDAKFRYWAWKPALANANSGAYESGDPSETIAFRSVDAHSAAQIINAPFNDSTNHTIDLPIWTDLGDGDEFATRVHTVDDETTDSIPSPTTDPTTDCSLPDTACGKWIEVVLNSTAQTQLNNANGLWVMGSHMTTIGNNTNNEGKEWVNNGALVDLSPDKAPYPDFITPLPELIIERTI